MTNKPPSHSALRTENKMELGKLVIPKSGDKKILTEPLYRFA